MTDSQWQVRRLRAVDAQQIEQLADVLTDCVEGGASVSFMLPLSRATALAFWQHIARGVESGSRALLVAEDAAGIVGTVQLVLEQPENQPHRADLAKMLVHRRARRHGIGEALMQAAEAMAIECGKTVLVLDTVTGGTAERLYARLGWERVGVIPDYALMPEGGLVPTTVFYRRLRAATPMATLIADLQHPDKNVRIEAALEIGKVADLSALPVLLTRLGAEPDFFVRENVTWAIVRMGDAAVLPLIALLGGDDESARFNAAHTLSKLADDRAVPALLALLDDVSPALVQKAVYALGRIGDVRALPPLVARVGVGTRELRSTVNEALEAFGERAVAALVGRLDDGDGAVRVELTEILGVIGGAEAARALAIALQDAAWEVRFAAVNALRHVHDAAATDALTVANSDAHPHVRMLAARIIADRAVPPRGAARSA
jgi:HEAT repeat protein/GNAT superfamily N-acetyltransferase